ncbi:hypothetical protein CsSME_00036978 [Camellia sinensis var. sinensis]
MENIKLWYLDTLPAWLPLPPEETLQQLIECIRKLVKRTINCYVERVDRSEDELVEMMIVDGCFLLELFRIDVWLVP